MQTHFLPTTLSQHFAKWCKTHRVLLQNAVLTRAKRKAKCSKTQGVWAKGTANFMQKQLPWTTKKVEKRRNKHRISTFFPLKNQKAAQKLWFKLLPLCNIHFCVSVLMHKHLHHFILVWGIKSLFWGIAYRRFCLSKCGVALKYTL